MSDAYYELKKRIREFKPEIRKCEECSGEFTATVPHHYYCSDPTCRANRMNHQEIEADHELRKIVKRVSRRNPLFTQTIDFLNET